MLARKVDAPVPQQIALYGQVAEANRNCGMLEVLGTDRSWCIWAEQRLRVPLVVYFAAAIITDAMRHHESRHRIQLIQKCNRDRETKQDKHEPCALTVHALQQEKQRKRHKDADGLSVEVCNAARKDGISKLDHLALLGYILAKVDIFVRI